MLIKDIFYLHQEIKKYLSHSYKHCTSALSTGTTWGNLKPKHAWCLFLTSCDSKQFWRADL